MCIIAYVTLFDEQRRQRLSRHVPLAARMRPRTFDELVSQEHIAGPDRVLRKSIEADQVPSMVLWGPPGSGKTTLALLIATVTRSHFAQVSAVAAGVADLRKIIQEARDRLGMNDQRTILFIDDIHRFNKSQQDSVLPYVEDGTVTLIGATTENPSFEVIGPLLSRCRVFPLNPFAEEHVGILVDRALSDAERRLQAMQVVLQEEARPFLLTAANGDARMALNTIEFAASAITPDALQHRALMYDKAGDLHYDTISAYIKSVRASDPDAAIYWLSRMIEAG